MNQFEWEESLNHEFKHVHDGSFFDQVLWAKCSGVAGGEFIDVDADDHGATYLIDVYGVHEAYFDQILGWSVYRAHRTGREAQSSLPALWFPCSCGCSWNPPHQSEGR